LIANGTKEKIVTSLTLLFVPILPFDKCYLPNEVI
jgi:hypothetical protein